MSHVATPTLSPRSQVRAHWGVAISALMVLIAAVAVTLVLVVDNGTRASSSGVASPQAAVRSDGGPDESTVASSVGSRPSAVPDESAIAASIGSASTPNAGGPDESTVAASISGP